MSIKARLRRMAHLTHLTPATTPAIPPHTHGELERLIVQQLAVAVKVIRGIDPSLTADLAANADTLESRQRYLAYLMAAGASSAFREHLRAHCPACAVAFLPPSFAAGNLRPADAGNAGNVKGGRQWP